MMEQVHSKITQKVLTGAGSAQTKIGARLDLKSFAKRVLNVTPICHIGGVENTETECKVTGKVITRAIFIDETDSYNSEERTDEFAVVLPNTGFAGVLPSARIIESNSDKYTKSESDTISGIQCEHLVGVSLAGLKPTEVTYLTDIRGEEVEVKHTDREICTFNEVVTEKFDIGEIFKLDSNVEGVLGVELNATVRDIVCKDDKSTVKGVAVVGVSVVRGTDEGRQIIQNMTYDFEFSKTLKRGGEIACGNVAVADCVIKIEHREKPELVLDATLLFTGAGLTYQTVKSVADAIAPKHEIDFGSATITSCATTKQHAILADVEGNVSLGNNAPFMSRVLWANCGTVSNVSVKPADDKVIVEGVLNANLVYECEEKNIHTHTVEVPFSVNVKIDGASTEHSIGANVVPLTCNIKARRGKELLVDARLGVTVFGDKKVPCELVSAATEGAQRPTTGASIIIHVVGAGETLWDLAKRTGISTREIAKQNGGVETLTGGERIVTYKQRAV